MGILKKLLIVLSKLNFNKIKQGIKAIIKILIEKLSEIFTTALSKLIFEDETKKLIQHLGLKWQDECLKPENNKRIVHTASTLQVRRKVFQGSSEKWKKFEPFLNGVFNHFEN